MRILGFPVQVRPGFAVFLLLILAINGVELGIWLAGSVAVFTLAHELGHALAARRTGAEASIALDFLAGYASFTPTRALTRSERAGIAIAGPAVQIALGVAALVVIGVNPFSHDSFAAANHSLAIWWAGPMIGAFNLIPVMPLDGGTIAAEVVDVFAPGRGRRILSRISAPITLAAFVAMVLSDEWRPLASFAAILLVFQLQLLSADSTSRDSSSGEPGAERSVEAIRRTADAERLGWTSTGATGPSSVSSSVGIPPGTNPSPWLVARRLLDEGRVDEARRAVLDDLVDESGRPRPWWPPHSATPEQLSTVVDLVVDRLPEPRATWPAQSVETLVWALRHTGRHRVASDYGSRCFSSRPDPVVAVHVAASVAALGDEESAVRWITVAARSRRADDATDRFLRHSVLIDHEFESVRHHPDVAELLHRLADE
jgi:Zn-dependent protease